MVNKCLFLTSQFKISDFLDKLSQIKREQKQKDFKESEIKQDKEKRKKLTKELK